VERSGIERDRHRRDADFADLSSEAGILFP
jgi:hypothetical protein